QTRDYFYERLAAFLEITDLDSKAFFPRNNQLYFIVSYEVEGMPKLGIVTIPSNEISRFFTVPDGNKTFVVFIDDIIRQNIAAVFPGLIKGVYAVKVTRDADLELDNEYEGSLAVKIAKQIKKRDFGLATRFLYPPDFPADLLQIIYSHFNLRKSNGIKGGHYHNLKDFFSFPIDNQEWKFAAQPP